MSKYFDGWFSIKQAQGVFFIIIGIFSWYSNFHTDENLANWVGIFTVALFIFGISMLYEGSIERYKIIKAPSGGKYDSKSEERVGEYFLRKKIKFYLHPAIKLQKSFGPITIPFMRRILHPDFFLPEYNVYVEYWGMVDDENYNEKRKKKMKDYKANDVDIISIYPKNLENNSLDWNFTQKLLSLIRDREGNNTWNRD
jgi:hypothetical protein